MSTDWNIKCVDCDSIHRFDDANHQDDLMRTLIAHADAIVALAPLLAADSGIEFKTYYGAIDAAWFVTHKGHRLKPIDEYGRLDDQCHEYIRCACGSSKNCVLDIGHAGEHTAVRP